MYDIAQIRTELIRRIQSYIKTPVVICEGAYDEVNEEWVLSKCGNAIESVYYVDEEYVCFKICQLEPDGVFGYFERVTWHDTEHIYYEQLNLEGLYEILNYIDQQGIDMPRSLPKNYKDREDFKLE